eukprot:6134902-Pyramimonas_sp.AAC.1
MALFAPPKPMRRRYVGDEFATQRDPPATFLPASIQQVFTRGGCGLGWRTSSHVLGLAIAQTSIPCAFFQPATSR